VFVTMNNVQVSPIELLRAAELQPHVCDPVRDLQGRVECGEQIDNTPLPHHDSRLVEHISNSHSHGSDPPTDNVSPRQGVGKPMKTGLHYSHSVVHRPSSDRISPAGIESGFRQTEWKQTSDHYRQVYATLLPRQLYNDELVITIVSASFLLVCTNLCQY